ncbi:MAG: hypothetical protein JJLCMIEE_02903 [Acidimicrobiales bacterium]|nr:MAG: hypothetical protein EDR02_14915 [Actinomycetota bacterium]MBV6509803.1 hypothetical protein [Acidimicrobiales bacterium]RIK04402.1 MAG: hypothetical protein DCC48_13570 [Acidobacteriota bacterium]
MTEGNRIDSVDFFDSLAANMNSRPTEYEVLGDVDIDLGLLMRRRDDGDFRLRLRFEGIECTGVAEAEDGDEKLADCYLDGDIDAWQAMFDDIADNGRAVGRQTINSLTLVGEAIRVRGDDPLGIDKFFRYNQTMQAFLDGAAQLASAGAG